MKFPAHPRIIFMGTPEFAVPALKALVENDHSVLSVVTQPDRPRGRGRKLVPSPVKQAAMQYGLEILQPEKAFNNEFCAIIREKAPDVLVVVAYGQILKKELLEIPHWGALNIHASLLPKYRGAAPIHRAILDNEARTGLTAMRIDEGLDTGPILLQEEVPVFADETAGELHDRLAALSGSFLLKTFDGLAEKRLIERPQDHAKATYATKIERSMALIGWDQPARTISALIRGLDPWPGAFTTLKGKEIKLFCSRVVDEKRSNVLPGVVSGNEEGGLEVGTGNGVILIRELQLSGKKRLPARDFLKGFPLDKGTQLGT